MRFLPTLLIALLVAGTARAQTDAGRLTVTGRGEVAAVPDMATLRIGVTTGAETAETALEETSRRLSAVLSTLEKAGIASRDLQTQGLSLSPRRAPREGRDGQREIVGFTARNGVTARVRALEDLGAILDRVVGKGANTLTGLSFGLSDPEAEQDAARRAAVAAAQEKARLYAEAAGISLGRILSIEEAGNAPRPVQMQAEAFARDSVPVAEGEVTVEAAVTLVYAIEP